MEHRIIQTAFLALLLTLASAAAAFGQDEATYRKALAEAYQQSDPSEHRAQAMKKLLDAPENKRMSETRFNQFVADKFKELMEIDFYAAFLTQSMPTAEIIKWHEVFELLPVESVAAIKKLNQWKTGGGSKAAYPAGIPQPGSGWSKIVSSNVRPANPPSTTAVNTSQPPNSAKDVLARAKAAQAYLRGRQQYDAKDYDAAVLSFSECVNSNPKADACYLNRGLSHAKKRNYDAAIADYTEAIKLAPQKEQAYINRGVAYGDLENHESALVDFEAALKIDPNNEKVKDVLKATRDYMATKKNYLEETNKRSKLSDDFLQQGNRQMGAKNWNEAINLYTKCVEANPLNLDCFNFRGVAYGAIKEYDKAITDFSVILLLKQVPKIYYRRALAHRDKGDLDAAIKDFTEAVKLAPEDPENYSERGTSYIFKNDFAPATVDLTQAIKMNPQEPKYYVLRGYAQQKAGNRDAAIADYKKALQINPNFAPAKQQLQGLGVQP